MRASLARILRSKHRTEKFVVANAFHSWFQIAVQQRHKLIMSTEAVRVRRNVQRVRQQAACTLIKHAARRIRLLHSGDAFRRWFWVSNTLVAIDIQTVTVAEKFSYAMARRVFVSWKAWTLSARSERRCRTDATMRVLRLIERCCHQVMSRAWRTWLVCASESSAASKLAQVATKQAQMRQIAGATGLHYAFLRLCRGCVRSAWVAWHSFVQCHRDDEFSNKLIGHSCTMLANALEHCIVRRTQRALRHWINVTSWVRSQEARIQSCIERRSIRQAQRTLDQWKQQAADSRAERQSRKLALSRLARVFGRCCRADLLRSWHTWILYVAKDLALQDKAL